MAILCGLLTAHESRAQGQGYIRRHMEFYDDKPIHYGFLFGVPFTRFNIQRSESFLQSDSAFLIQSPTLPAFRMGFIVNAFLNERFDLRTTPSVSLYERQVKYSYPSGDERTEKRESTWVEIPLLLKYKSNRRINTRMYMLAGVTLGIETNVKRREGGSFNRLNTATSDLSLDYGVGFEQFFEFFKFSPELRFSHGLGNMLQPANNSVSTGINRLSTHTVTLYLNFE
ncbi:porin family protein [Telluribacter sp.]|uniref:type IX secretion/gliding motility protein PorT/SprT n=1 Tax=Telluribacter sp. TaxID=1978767 RepID=UPI002E144B7E|nr:porin family protein [Telluribacter sp.]